MGLMTLFGILILFAPAAAQVSTLPNEDQSGMQCNPCCQGPSGLPGVPGSAGIPGASGLPGRDGFKGNIGMKGEIGERGPDGVRGPVGGQGPIGDRGDRGFPGIQGRPGVQGPRGTPGLQGLIGAIGRPGVDGGIGSPGPVGLKGSKGDSLEPKKSAFSVFKSVGQTGNVGDAVIFEVEQTNVGSHFDMQTHKFTCQIAGTYVFFFTIAVNRSSDDPYIMLIKDGANVNAVHIADSPSDQSSSFLQSSNMAILQLATGNKVWLEFVNFSGDEVFSDTYHFSSFSGFLLYAD